MNKSAEQQAEEMYPCSKDNGLMDNLGQIGKQEAFLADHHSRDEEVNKLVEVLEWVDNYTHTTMDDNRTVLLEIERRIEEALKPYQK